MEAMAGRKIVLWRWAHQLLPECRDESARMYGVGRCVCWERATDVVWYGVGIVAVVGVDSNALSKDQGSRWRAREWHFLEVRLAISCSHISLIARIRDKSSVCVHFNLLSSTLTTMIPCATQLMMSCCNTVPPFASEVPHQNIIRVRLEDAPVKRQVLDFDLDDMLIQRRNVLEASSIPGNPMCRSRFPTYQPLFAFVEHEIRSRYGAFDTEMPKADKIVKIANDVT